MNYSYSLATQRTDAVISMSLEAPLSTASSRVRRPLGLPLSVVLDAVLDCESSRQNHESYSEAYRSPVGHLGNLAAERLMPHSCRIDV